MRKINDFVLKKPIITLLILLAITGYFTFQIYDKARIETNLDEYMPENHPAFEKSDHYEELFGISDAVVVAVENRNGIYNKETLKQIENIQKELANLDEINGNEIKSLATADNIKGSDMGLEVNPFYTDIPDSEKELNELKEKVSENEMVSGRLVAENNKVTLIQAELVEGGADRVELYKQLEEALDKVEGPGKLYIAGQPVVEGTLANLMPEDMKTMIPLVILIISIVLLLTFKSLKSTILTLGVVLFSTIWAFGLMSALGIPIYAVSTMIPVMLIALGVADGIHLLTHLKEKMKDDPEADIIEVINDMIKNMWKPVVMTSITTAVGFISLLTSEVYAVKYFGLFTAFGVIAAMIFSLIFIPAGLKLIGLPKLRKKDKRQIEKEENSNKFYKFADWVLFHKKKIIIASILLFVLGIIGAQSLWINSSFLSKFQKDEEIIVANNFINEHFGGTTNLNVVIKSENNDAMKNPEYLNDIWELQNELEEMDGVGDSLALTNFLRRINKVMNEDQEKYNRIPKTRKLSAQYLLLYSMSGDPDDLNSVIDYDYRRANLQVNLKDDDARLINKVMDKIENYQKNSSLFELEIDYAGSAYTNRVFANLILEGQIKSLLLSIGIVIVLLGFLYKSVSAGVLGSLPIIITAVVNFGIMGYLNIALNTTTALISSIAVGMGIDYSIHLLSKYQKYGKQGLSPAKAARMTMKYSGKAIAFNAIVVITGFMVLIFSSFPPNRELGYLVSLSLFSSFVLTLTLVVALIDRYKPKFIFGEKSSKK
ncbi:MAG: efflux RND transporter permease subunit [Bacillota bacterium]